MAQLDLARDDQSAVAYAPVVEADLGLWLMTVLAEALRLDHFERAYLDLLRHRSC